MSTLLRELTPAEIAAAVRAVAERLPDMSLHRSTGCMYFKEVDDTYMHTLTPEPCCIVGHAVADLGVEHTQFQGKTNAGIRMNVAGFTTIAVEFGMETTETCEVVAWISDVQGFQDGGDRWAVAVQKADAKRPNDRIVFV